MLKKKIIKLLVGTNNKEKLKEIKDLLPKTLKIYSPNNFKIRSPIENGNTFEENSLIKAKYFSNKTKMVCLSDDSGLEIDILDGDPGIYSARWGGKEGDFVKAINRVFRALNKKDKNWKTKKIKARFICALTIYGPNQKTISSVGKIDVNSISSPDLGCLNPKVLACKNCLSKFKIIFSKSKLIFFIFLNFFLYFLSPKILFPL